MAIIITPGAGVNDSVTVLPPQIALTRSALDQVRSRGSITRLAGFTNVPAVRHSNRSADDESKCQKDEEAAVAEEHVD